MKSLPSHCEDVRVSPKGELRPRHRQHREEVDMKGLAEGQEHRNPQGEFLTLGRISLYKHTLTTCAVPPYTLERGMDNI